MTRPTPIGDRLSLVAAVLATVVGSAAALAEGPRVSACRLGLGGEYKAGCWAPLTVTVEGGDEPLAVDVVAATPDGDGVGVATFAPGRQPMSTEPGRISVQRLYVRPGSSIPTVEVRLYAAGKQIDKRLFTSGAADAIESGQALDLGGETHTRLFLQLGGDPGLVGQLLPADVASRWAPPATAAVTDAADLPRDAIGYDAFDTVVLLAGSRAGSTGGGWLGAVSPSDPRLTALIQWVESGGRLVVSCGSGGAALVAPGGALEPFLPGRYTGPTTLTVATPLERFADAPADAEGIDLAGGSLTASGLADVRGVVEAFAGRTTQEAPLVVRSPLGFGQVTFVAVDLDAPAIRGWPGSGALLRKLVGYQPASEEPGSYYRYEVVDSLVSVLDNSFADVNATPFLAIVGLVVLYLLLIGPGDYFFVKKVLGRMEATWITFPIIVAATSAAAYLGAYWLKGDKLRVNEVEITDVDCASGRTRALVVSHLFSPEASRYSLALSPRRLDGSADPGAQARTAWMATSGGRFGGAGPTGVRPDYQIDATPGVGGAGPPVVGMPIQVWSTKTLLSHTAGQTDRLVDAQLTPDGDGLVQGSITNDTGADLQDCRLLYGDWAWKLPDLADGETTLIDRDTSPLKVTTLLRSQAATSGRRTWRNVNSVQPLAEALSVGSRATGATEPVSRYLPGVDIGAHLDFGAAVLLAEVAGGAQSELVRVSPATGETTTLVPQEAADDHRTWSYARFILPVEK
ncbi:hypothetical protein [Botrimarina sp.]|uniref:hypothetical protein n=1 Tax=Botrimarina sp. TaxID=2795802 RepID=UPI0032EFD73B